MLNRKLVKFLSFRYIILAAILIVLAGGLLLLPKYEQHEGISPEELLSKAISPERYISTDALAHKLVSQDPSFILIDVRDEVEYTKYSLPNAINIPLKKLLDEDSVNFLNQSQYDVILFSNDNFYADQAWLLCNRLDFKNLKVLKGGLNTWYNTIINPPLPTQNLTTIDHELYNTRKAASMYFGVAYPEQFNVDKPIIINKATPKKVITVKKKKKAVAEGGC